MKTQIPTITPEQLHAAQQGGDWRPPERGRLHPLMRYGPANRTHTLEQV